MNNQSGWLLTGLKDRPWWQAVMALERTLAGAGGDVVASYAQLFRSLAATGHASLAEALAAELLHGELPVDVELLQDGASRQALQLDLDRVSELAACDWQQQTVSLAGQQLPGLHGLASGPDATVSELARSLAGGSATVEQLLAIYRKQGQGQLARGRAWRLLGSRLEQVANPVPDEFSGLHGLDTQLSELRAAVEPWLAGRARLHLLLYGPRGSGKSTAARSLLKEYGDVGLRMVEVPPQELPGLAAILKELAASPLKFVLFVDDLGFGRDDSGWQQLKTLLDGTLQALPQNVMVLATSNRRSLVSQRHADRPDPLDDDAAAWDTLDERMALADRFGLVITFPASDQRRYLAIIAELAAARGLDSSGLREAALLFARRGNGMSGRTARQFVDSLAP